MAEQLEVRVNRRRPFAGTLWIPAAVVLLAASCQGSHSDRSTPPQEGGAPLLLDEEEKIPETAADNSRCHVCHLNYQFEAIAVGHAKVGIGCKECHGVSDEHIADESWASGGNGTAPDIMYPREKINPFCHTCHPADKMRPLEHKAFLAGTTKEKYCTDCHGEHRLLERKCKWK